MFLPATAFLLALWQSRASTLAFCLWSHPFFLTQRGEMPKLLTLVAQTVKNWPAMRETCTGCLVRKIPWGREWSPTPVFLPAESHGQRSLAGNSPWGHTESDTTAWLTHIHTSPALLCPYDQPCKKIFFHLFANYLNLGSLFAAEKI